MCKIFIALAIVGLSVQLALAAPEKMDCSKFQEALDDLGSAQGMTSLNDKYKLPTTPEELAKRCEVMKDAILTLRKYNRDCYSSLTQTVFSAMLRTRSQLNEASCNPDSPEAKEVIEGNKCIVDNALEAVRNGEKKVVVSTQVLFESQIPDEKLRLRRACCNVMEGKKYFVDATKEKCSKHEKLYSDYVDSYTSEAMALICPANDKLECDKLEALKIEGVEPKTKFFLVPTLNLIKTLDHQ